LGKAREKWQKVPGEVYERMREEWLPNCPDVSHIPSKTSTVRKRDVKNQLINNDNGPVIIQQLVCLKCKRDIHNSMTKPVEEGGLEGALDDEGNVMISETSMRRRFPNWIVPMSTRHKSTCVCDKCGVPMEIQDSLNLKRPRLLKKLKDIAESKPAGRAKDTATTIANEYEEAIMEDAKLKHDRPSKMVDQITCSPVVIDHVAIHKFACVVGDCGTCKDMYRPIPYEAECVEKIKYNMYIGHNECTWHGDGAIEQYEDDNGKKKRRCKKCVDMSDEEKEAWLQQQKPARIVSNKYKFKKCQPMKDFVKIGGVYQDAIQNYRLHRFHRTFLGTKVAIKKLRAYNLAVASCILLQSDYMEKYQPQPDGQFQSQYFGKRQSLSCEGHATWYQSAKTGEQVLIYYGAMSDKKRQDGATTAENINRLLADIFMNEKDFIMSSLKMLISMCDGCSAQYRSGSVCYELMLLAIQWGIPIHRVIQAPGHGKCICDSQGGLDKTVLDIFFDCLVANPEALVEGLQRVETHDRTEDGLVSLAEVCHRILSDECRKYGSVSNSNRAKNRKIKERRYFVRPEGVGSGKGVKYICDGFSKGDGIRSNYHIVADPELVRTGERPNCIAMRRFPCFCDACVEQLKRPIDTRYTGTNRNCEYWEIFEREDGTSYNDWKIIDLKPKPKEYKEEDDLNRLEVTVRNIGCIMASQIYVGAYGVYVADDSRYDYYVFQCTEAAKKADGDRVFERDGNEFAVKEGEWYCEGVWLDKVPGTANWHYLTPQKCIVRMQIVIDADVEMQQLSDDNQFPANLRNRVREDATQKGAMRIGDCDHDFLMEVARQRTALDFEDVVYGDVEGGDDDGSVYGEYEGVEGDGTI